MKEGESISEYFSRVMSVSNKMWSNGETMRDHKVVQKILRTLTEKFTYIVVSIEESKDTNNISVDELQSTLLIHEQKFKRVTQEDDGQALKAEASINKGRGDNKWRTTNKDGQASKVDSNRGRGRGNY